MYRSGMRIADYLHMLIDFHPFNREGITMQFREQARKIQCIRTVYDKSIGRGRQVVVATLPRWSTGTPPDDVMAKLTEGEREQLTDLLAKRKAESEESNTRYTAMSADSWLATLAKAISGGQTLRPEQADAIWQGMGEVAKALRKAGHAKPKAVKKAKPEPAQPEVMPEAVGLADSTGEPKPAQPKRVRKPRAPKAPAAEVNAK